MTHRIGDLKQEARRQEKSVPGHNFPFQLREPEEGAGRSEAMRGSELCQAPCLDNSLRGDTLICVMSSQQATLKLPATIVRRVNRAAKRENKTPSDLAAEALKWYFMVSKIPEETPTPAELRAIRRGEAAIKRGDYITLDELRRKERLARRPRQPRAKIS
jgi:predicted transcriptional regulator